jgi:hypothetical protein
VEWGWGHAKVADYCREVAGEPWMKSACGFCLAGDTEVVTRDGIRPIRELAGGRHRLVVPQCSPGPHRGRQALNSHGFFDEVEVWPFGVQPLFKVTLRRARQKKVVRATAEHRWLVWGKRKNPNHKGYHPTTIERTTCDLVAGDRLRRLRAQPPCKNIVVPFALARGFVYGDGARGSGERPATVAFYTKAKAVALLPYFGRHRVAKSKKGGVSIYGLPRTWKRRPTLRESRSFLLSWLAGYFAADGSVSKSGQATLESASPKSVRFARDVASICGVRYGTILSKSRVGINQDGPSLMYRLSLDPRDLPDWFFLLGHHRQRIKAAEAKRAKCDRDWVVESVERTGQEEEVYCAVVPERQAFALADDLMTGNCPFSRGKQEVLARFRRFPSYACQAMLMEHVSLAMNSKMTLYADKSVIDLIYADGNAEAVRLYEDDLATQRWALYRLRRCRVGKQWNRSVAALERAGRDCVYVLLGHEAARAGVPVEEEPPGIRRAWLRRRHGGAGPDGEEFLVACPDVVRDKQVPRFEDNWSRLPPLPLAG